MIGAGKGCEREKILRVCSARAFELIVLFLDFIDKIITNNYISNLIMGIIISELM